MQCCIVYVINLLEFYLVRGIACLLIPLFFIDATKSYAENIIKILLTYFFKILITVFICYFALGLFLDVVTQTVATADTNSSLILITYLFTIFIGVMFCGKVPEILSVVISGSPNMGFGTILQSARGAIHTASHLSGLSSKAIKGAKDTVGGMVRGGVGMGMGLFLLFLAHEGLLIRPQKVLKNLILFTKIKGQQVFLRLKLKTRLWVQHLRLSVLRDCNLWAILFIRLLLVKIRNEVKQTVIH